MYSTSGVVILLLNFCFILVDCQFAASVKECGSKRCQSLQYCDQISYICEPCSKVCENNHNYDENRCNSDCQDYLHLQTNRTLVEEIKRIRSLATISLSLTCILFAILIVIAILYHRRKQQIIAGWLRKKLKLKEQKSKSDRNNTSVSVTAASGKPDLRLDMPSIGMQTPSINGNTPSTATTTLSRRPTEDNTLDYAYDNPVMVSTPSPVSKPHESAL